tara:strand:- start:684 stop:785 length:102 start_codon:yes stop_codon:yes gene_type:complete
MGVIMVTIISMVGFTWLFGFVFLAMYLFIEEDK